MNENPFYEVMSGHPDAKLLDIVENRRDEYNPEALSAAEDVLSSRNITWAVKKGRQEELRFENAREEINYRLAHGENIAEIRNDLKLRGLDVFEFAEQDQEEEAKNDPEFAAKRKKMGLRVGAVVMLFYGLLKLTSRDRNAGTLFVIVFFIVVVLVLLSFLVKSDKK